MILVSCKYTQEYNITFNPNKTVCNTFERKINIDEYDFVSINGFPVQWSENMRHTGNIVDSTLSDSLDCRYK